MEWKKTDVQSSVIDVSRLAVPFPPSPHIAIHTHSIHTHLQILTNCLWDEILEDLILLGRWWQVDCCRLHTITIGLCSHLTSATVSRTIMSLWLHCETWVWIVYIIRTPPPSCKQTLAQLSYSWQWVKPKSGEKPKPLWLNPSMLS